MIEVKGVSNRFGATHALKNVSFKVEPGRILGFLGANGAGKTTTMDIICGCIGVDSGAVLVCGVDVSESPVEAKRQIGYLPDEPPLHVDMRVVDFLLYSGQLRGMKGTKLKQRLAMVLERLSLGDVQTRQVGNLSKGYKQRVGLAQAILHDPKVLVLDEPTEGLDPNQITEIRLLIQSLRSDHTVILSSHILSEVDSTCDDIVIIDRGEILAQGSKDELRGSMQRELSYTLRVARDAAGLADRLRGLSWARNVTLNDAGSSQEVIVALAEGGESLDGILAEALKGAHGIMEVVKQRSTLEDVFANLTKQHGGA